MRDPQVVRGMLEDYRAELGVAAEHERADRAVGRRVRQPPLVLWSLRDDLDDLYGDPLAIWQGWADNVTGAGYRLRSPRRRRSPRRTRAGARQIPRHRIPVAERRRPPVPDTSIDDTPRPSSGNRPTSSPPGSAYRIHLRRLPTAWQRPWFSDPTGKGIPTIDRPVKQSVQPRACAIGTVPAGGVVALAAR